MDQILNDLKALVVPAAKNLIFALLVLVIGFKVINIVSKKFKKRKQLEGVDASAVGFVISFLTITLKVAVIVTVVAIMGVPMSSIVALIASAGVAIGLAVQGALSNFVGGIMLLLFRPFKVGDFIESQSVSGTVKEISVIYTSLLTPDNKFITIPNGTLTNSIITNYSTEKDRRLDMNVTVSYDVDIDKVKEILLSTIKDYNGILNDPAPAAIVSEYGVNGINYVLRFWCKNDDYWTIKFDLNERIRNALKENGMEIPVNKLDIKISKD